MTIKSGEAVYSCNVDHRHFLLSKRLRRIRKTAKNHVILHKTLFLIFGIKLLFYTKLKFLF